MNNIMSTCECNSGCESGWTMYLDQSSYSDKEEEGKGYRGKKKNVMSKYEQNEEDEDLSMVSDASSGPRLHFFQEEEGGGGDEGEGCFGHFAASASEQRKVTSTIAKHKTRACPKLHSLRGSRNSNSLLDDTASSPVLKKAQGPMEQAMGLSKQYKEGKSAFQKQFGFLNSSASEKSGGLGKREWQ